MYPYVALKIRNHVPSIVYYPEENNDKKLTTEDESIYEVAVNAIQNEVSNWTNKIDELGYFSLKHVGDFSLNSERNLVFVPVDQINYLKESFGLSSFVSPSVKRQEYKEQVEVLEEKAPIAFTPEKRRSFKALKYAAIVTISLGLTGALGYKLYDNYLEQVKQETLLVETNVQKKINQKIQEATFVIENPLPSVTLTVAAPEKTPYHVVAGAFRIESNAENAYQTLLKLGFKAKRLAPNKHGLYPVLYGSYSTYSEAHQAMKNIQKLDNKDAWLLVEEL